MSFCPNKRTPQKNFQTPQDIDKSFLMEKLFLIKHEVDCQLSNFWSDDQKPKFLMQLTK